MDERRRKFSTGRTGVALFVALSLMSAPAPVSACAFHLAKPERTTLDWIVDATDLVLARPDADNSYAYEVSEVLVGTDSTFDIGFLVDSTTRRKLASQPGDAILFARADGEEWRRVAYVDDRVRAVLSVALYNRQAMEGGYAATYSESRKAFVEGLQGSGHPLLEAMVIAEFDKMPYEMLREVDLQISADRLRSDLWTLQGYPFQPIRALLLGLSDDAAAHAEITSFITRSEDRATVTNLGAFAAAFIELDGAGAVEHLASTMLSDPTQPLQKLEQIVMALSVQNTVADGEVQDAIADALAAFVELRPEAAGMVARQFATRSDWSQAQILEPLLSRQLLANAADLLSVSVYLAQARQADSLAIAPQEQDG